MSIILDKNRGRKRPLNRSIKRRVSYLSAKLGREFANPPIARTYNSVDCSMRAPRHRPRLRAPSITPGESSCPTLTERKASVCASFPIGARPLHNARFKPLHPARTARKAPLVRPIPDHRHPTTEASSFASLNLRFRAQARAPSAAAILYNLTFAEQIGCLPYANWVNGRISSDIPCSATA